MVDTNLLGWRLDGLLDQVHEVWRAEFAECLEGF